jgi:hypothetical protein
MKELFNDENKINEKSLIGFLAFLVMVGFAAAGGCFALIEVGRGGSSSIACNNANSGIYISVFANTDTLLGATQLYRICSDKLPALSGWYADGAKARNWNGSAFVGSPVQCII